MLHCFDGALLMVCLRLCSYVIFTAVVVLSERVEATVQKGFFRFVGTVIGGRHLLRLGTDCSITHATCGHQLPAAGWSLDTSTPEQRHGMAPHWGIPLSQNA
jgi:Aluminium activated malate transporter